MLKLILVPVVFGGVFGLVWLAFRTLGVARQLRTLQAQLDAYRRGDYEGQLKVVEGFRVKGSEPNHYLFFHGAACYQLGRLAEAELALKRSLVKEKDARQAMCGRDELGRVFMAGERWDEAGACFRQCIAEFPKRGTGHRGMAELLLSQGPEGKAALEAAQSAESADRAEKAHPGKLGQDVHDLNLAESLGVLAWALARNGAGAAEVERRLEEAFALCGEKTKPILAEIHFLAGQAYEELANATESQHHFRCATDADPVGNYGRLALSALMAPVK